MADIQDLFNTILPGIRLGIKTNDGFSFISSDQVAFVQIIRNRALIQPIDGDPLESFLEHGDFSLSLNPKPAYFHTACLNTPAGCFIHSWTVSPFARSLKS